MHECAGAQAPGPSPRTCWEQHLPCRCFGCLGGSEIHQAGSPLPRPCRFPVSWNTSWPKEAGLHATVLATLLSGWVGCQEGSSPSLKTGKILPNAYARWLQVLSGSNSRWQKNSWFYEEVQRTATVRDKPTATCRLTKEQIFYIPQETGQGGCMPTLYLLWAKGSCFGNSTSCLPIRFSLLPWAGWYVRLHKPRETPQPREN